MITTGIRRIGRLPVEVKVPRTFSDEDRQRLENAAMTCPVHKSLSGEVDSPVSFSWGK
jgi:putative redox protein